MAGTIINGAFVISNLTAPGVYVQVLAPTPGVIGVATNVAGVVGTSGWGPLNAPQLLGSPQDGGRLLGAIIQPATAGAGTLPATSNPFDLGSAIQAIFTQAKQAGGLAVQAVRVSDDSDAAASLALKDTTAVTPLTGGTLTGFWTGSLGNGITCTIALAQKTDGSSNQYFNVTVTPPPGYGLNTEFYPNVKGTTSGAANSPFWTNLAAAFTNGIAGVCGPSQLVKLTSPSATAENPAIITGSPMTGGLDGVTTAATVLTNAVGSAAANPYTGLFSLIGANPLPAAACIAGYGHAGGDLTSNNAIIQGFVDSSGCEFFCDFPLGETTAAGVTLVGTPASGGIADYNFVFVKDWAYWNDGVSGLRFSPMAPFAVGLRASTPPWQSLLNQPVQGILGTYRTVGGGAAPYSPSEVGLCNANGILLIGSPIPAGNVIGCRTGVNSSMQLNPATGPEEYASMTNYIAKTIAASFGQVVGQNQSNSKTDPLRAQVRHSQNTFFEGLATQSPPAIDDYNVICDTSNNNPTQVAAHIMTSAARVKYLSSVWYFVAQLIGGNTVQVSLQQGS
jgi:hypothetical protein